MICGAKGFSINPLLSPLFVAKTAAPIAVNNPSNKSFVFAAVNTAANRHSLIPPSALLKIDNTAANSVVNNPVTVRAANTLKIYLQIKIVLLTADTAVANDSCASSCLAHSQPSVISHGQARKHDTQKYKYVHNIGAPASFLSGFRSTKTRSCSICRNVIIKSTTNENFGKKQH